MVLVANSTLEIAAANGQSMVSVACWKISGPIIFTFTPPRNSGIAKLPIARAKTITTPAARPGSVSGRTILRNTRACRAPSESDASSTSIGIAPIDAASGSTMNGSSTWTSPMMTPVAVKISRTGLSIRPMAMTARFSTPKSPSAISQP